jgi:hypothetical protein
MGGGGLKELKRIEHEKAIWRDSGEVNPKVWTD